MENLIFTINAVIPLFVLTGLGYYLKNAKFLNPSFVEIFNAFAFKIAIPLSLFKTAYTSNIKENFSGKLVVVAVVTIFILSFVLYITVPRFTTKKRAGSMVQGMFRTNAVLFGLSLCTNLFGPDNVAPMAVLIAISVPLFNVISVIILALLGEQGGESTSVKSIMISIVKNPLLIGTFFGLACSILDVSLPPIIYTPIKDLAACATPLAMIALGGQFSFVSAKSNMKANIIVTTMRLVIIPAILMPIFYSLGFRGNELGSLFILFAAPTSTSSFVMAKSFGCDGELAGEIVLFTTLFASVSIFGWVFALKSLALI